MTIEKLLGMSASQLEALTQQQLEEYFKPYLPTTRPELQKPKENNIKKIISGMSIKQSKKFLAEQIMLQHGIKIKL